MTSSSPPSPSRRQRRRGRRPWPKRERPATPRALSAVDEAEAPESSRQRRVVTRDASSDDSGRAREHGVGDRRCEHRLAARATVSVDRRPLPAIFISTASWFHVRRGRKRYARSFDILPRVYAGVVSFLGEEAALSIVRDAAGARRGCRSIQGCGRRPDLWIWMPWPTPCCMTSSTSRGREARAHARRCVMCGRLASRERTRRVDILQNKDDVCKRATRASGSTSRRSSTSSGQSGCKKFLHGCASRKTFEMRHKIA